MSSDRLGPYLRRNRPSAMTIVALAPALLFVTGSSASLGWVRDPSPVLLLVGSAVVLAAGLSFSRFRAPTAFAFTLVLSIGLLLLIDGRVLPNPAEAFHQPISETLWFMNVRVWTFLGDLGRGLAQLRSRSLPGPALATAAYGLLAWQTVHWLVWSGLRRRAAWLTVLLCFALLMVRDVLSSRSPAWSQGMTFCVLIFAASATYAARVDSWDRLGLGYPAQVWESWTVSLAAVAAVVFFVTGLTTPQWRDSIQRFLDSHRDLPRRTSETAELGGSPSRTSFVPDLTVVGEPFPRGGKAIFYVRTSDSPTKAEGGGFLEPPSEQHYWRGAIYVSYTGRGWDMAPLGEAAAPIAGPPPAGSSRYALRQEFEILDLGDDRLFAASQPVLASEGVILRTAGDEDASGLVRGTVLSYSVVSWVTRATREELSAADSDYPASIRSAYLQLPPEVPQRVRALASRISAGAGSPFEKAERIQDYLRSSYVYREDLPPPPPGRDVVDYFLFDTSGGFCSYSASAMVVLLRLEGVPSRVVTGFATGDWDAREARYRVTESFAHAWVEVYFPGYGWIEFEPTPSRSPFEFHGSPATTAGPNEPPPVVEESSRLARMRSAVLSFVIPVASAGVLLAFVAWRRRRDRPAPERLLHTLYWRMRRRVATDGRAHLTPSEFIATYERRLASLPRLDRAARLLTSLYIQGTYSPRGATPREAAAARRVWRSAWWDRARLDLQPRAE